MAVAAVL